MTVNDCYLVGYVVKPHGTKGGLLVYIDADNVAEYMEMESVLVEKPEGLVPFFIDHLEMASQANHLIAYFDDVQTIEEAQALKATKLYAPLAELPELKADQFYYHEVVGFDVVDKQKGIIGQLKEVQDSSTNALLIVENGATEFLIPLKEPIYTGIDKAKKQLYVDCPEGLLELYANEN